MAALIVENLVKIYSKRTVVNKVSFQIKQGEIVGFLGANGAGKTTTFYMIVGLVKPDKGQILLENNGMKKNITNLAMNQRAKEGIGYLSQEPSVFRGLTVKENIKAILETLNLDKITEQEKLESLLEKLGIQHIANNKAFTLSGGERRRVEICRTLVTSPAFILLDEPFSGIDPITVTDIQKIISQLRDDNLGIIITDHNVREILKVVDRAYIIQNGEIISFGTAEEVTNDPKVKKVYLGESFTLK